MRLIRDVAKHKKKIKNSIKKYGYFAEHNFLHYIYSEVPDTENIVFDYGNDRTMLLQYDRKNDIWELFPCGILAPKSERLKMLLDAAKFILKKKKAKKFTIEVPEDLRKEILSKMQKPNSMMARTYTYILHWPVYNMSLWDPKLRGNKMKKLRNIRNKFFKENKIKVKDSKDVPKDELKRVFSIWLKKRGLKDHIDKEYYLSLIDSGFKGADMAKTIYVNGKPSTITAGWKIPRSNSYYSAIGIIDYSYPGLGEVANMDDLNRLKKKGYDYVDFGGSDKVLLDFKKKFRPEKIYKTYTFSIVRS